jgi:hypothetical protein
MLEISWRLIPVGLLGTWAFLQAVHLVSSLVLLALGLGAGQAWMEALLPSGQAVWLIEAVRLSEADLAGVLEFVGLTLSGGRPFGWVALVNLGLSAAIGLMYLSWLATWWARWRGSDVRTNV